ncbi:MAG TPA: aldo/keto reductase [Thermoanaerobaculia bacterium]|nr:aldo/keto reductase [Thermoanaerobaculia bacterium]
MFDLPPIGLGTWQTFTVPRPDVLRAFVELGGRLVDTSPMYGPAEDNLGIASEGVRERLFFATKVWTRGRDAGIGQMEDSERKLGGRVDLMQVHNLLDAATHLRTLRAWKDAGRIHFLGVTHYTASAHGDVAKYVRAGGIDAVQINYSVAEREAEKLVLPLAQERGIAVLINRPFGEGALLRRLRGKRLPSIATDLGCASWAALLLKFVIAHPAVTCAIPATSSLEHLRQNMNAMRGPMPDAQARERIAAAALE